MSTKCAFLFQNSIFFFENSVDPDQLAPADQDPQTMKV